MRSRFAFRWLAGLVMIAAVASVGIYTYNLGLAHGIAESARTIAAPGTAPVVVLWPRPWGFGFFPFFPFLFILFWFFVARGLFWRGAWRRRMHGEGAIPPQFEEWHRRAHAQQGPPPAPGGHA